MLSNFQWYRRLRGGKWARASGLLVSKRWYKLHEEAVDQPEECWEGMSRPDLGHNGGWIPVSARLPDDGLYHPVKARLKHDGTIIILTARYRNQQWEPFKETKPRSQIRVRAWLNEEGAVKGGHPI